MSEWIPVSERLPHCSGEFLVTVIEDDHYPDICIALYRDETYADEAYTWLINDGRVTHWMDLPEPPALNGEVGDD